MQDWVEAEMVERLKTMPPLSHYPDRNKPFSFERSHVIQYFMDDFELSLKLAVRLFERARRAKWIMFDHNNKEWMGEQYYKEKYCEEGYDK